jgi:carbon-monoxide dehydrogenase iron sulfur subunit
MKRVYVKEEWCLGCHLCEFQCAFANSGEKYMFEALKGKPLVTAIQIEEGGDVCFAVSCRHCREPLCVTACITGALTKAEDGSVRIDRSKCVGCHSCIMMCPYGAVLMDGDNVANKCQLCLTNSFGQPKCVSGCPNGAIVYEER